jgi:cysteine synthase A
MASTAYGGSSQLTDLLSTATETHTPQLKKHKFHIQGASEMVASIKSSLDKLATMKDSLFPTTVLFIEIPTNPDMKVPEIEKLALLLSDYEKITGKKVLLLVDSTFAPGSKIMLKLKSLVPDLNVMVFISLSKSVSRGITTAGCLVANHTPLGISLIKNVDQISKIMDTRAKPDQILALVQHHVGVEKRCLDAYNVAKVAGSVLVESVKSLTGHDLQLAFVKPHQAEIGFTTSTFSFNLPSPKNATQEILQGLAQRFTDLLCENKVFKPCVSFGQDNGLVYCTVPATSTQGAISEEDKAQQAIGGVQLVRLSFPPTCEIEVVKKVIAQSVSSIYS